MFDSMISITYDKKDVYKKCLFVYVSNYQGFGTRCLNVPLFSLIKGQTSLDAQKRVYNRR